MKVIWKCRINLYGNKIIKIKIINEQFNIYALFNIKENLVIVFNQSSMLLCLICLQNKIKINSTWTNWLYFSGL